MPGNTIKKRIQSLFSEIEHLASNPQLDAAILRNELESLRMRVAALEEQINNQETASLSSNSAHPSTQQAKPTRNNPILYEKEQVGFAYSSNRAEPLQSARLDGLDIQRSIHTPLTETGQPIGAVLVEPAPETEFSSEEAALTEAIAHQVSIQIQNLRLLEAAERAKAEAQAATRQFAHEGWQSYLDAIHQAERIGYAYDQAGVEPYGEDMPEDADIQESISVLDQHIGKLYLKSNPGNPLSEEDKELVAAVARQLGQQVESLRLVADSARARAEAEEATRRITRENWQEYANNKEKKQLGFIYNENRVLPLEQEITHAKVSQPLIVRGETIGQLAVLEINETSPETKELLTAIASQASIHLETLRLNEELQKRAAELQELDRLKSSFLANMSHELRTPLNSILGFSDVMLEGIDGPLTPNMENDLKLIQKNGQHLLLLINDVLDMAKIESGRMNLHPEKFRVHDVLQEVINICSTLASSKNLALYIEPESDDNLEILADITRIRQVIINLINNAIKFTEKGQVTLQANKHSSEQILIKVKDTGLGIPASHLESIFQEFSQVDTSTTRKAGGTGLGLPISRKLVEMHGGRMWAESAGIENQGSIFYVELPIEAKIEEIEQKVK